MWDLLHAIKGDTTTELWPHHSLELMCTSQRKGDGLPSKDDGLMLQGISLSPTLPFYCMWMEYCTVPLPSKWNLWEYCLQANLESKYALTDHAEVPVDWWALRAGGKSGVTAAGFFFFFRDEKVYITVCTPWEMKAWPFYFQLLKICSSLIRNLLLTWLSPWNFDFSTFFQDAIAIIGASTFL